MCVYKRGECIIFNFTKGNHAYCDENEIVLCVQEVCFRCLNFLMVQLIYFLLSFDKSIDLAVVYWYLEIFTRLERCFIFIYKIQIFLYPFFLLITKKSL